MVFGHQRVIDDHDRVSHGGYGLHKCIIIAAYDHSAQSPTQRVGQSPPRAQHALRRTIEPAFGR
jgi:hypothetical protein